MADQVKSAITDSRARLSQLHGNLIASTTCNGRSEWHYEAAFTVFGDKKRYDFHLPDGDGKYITVWDGTCTSSLVGGKGMRRLGPDINETLPADSDPRDLLFSIGRRPLDKFTIVDSPNDVDFSEPMVGYEAIYQILVSSVESGIVSATAVSADATRFGPIALTLDLHDGLKIPEIIYYSPQGLPDRTIRCTTYTKVNGANCPQFVRTIEYQREEPTRYTDVVYKDVVTLSDVSDGDFVINYPPGTPFEDKVTGIRRIVGEENQVHVRDTKPGVRAAP